MNLEELNDLNLDNMGVWPAPVKIGAVLLLCCLVGFGWYHYDTKDQLNALSKMEKTEQELRRKFEMNQAKAANLEAYKRQLEEMKESFGAMLRQLPNKTEVADLLVDVSQTGLAAGLEFQLFDPVAELPKEFYAELPIQLRVVGSYHQFGEFISGLAALPRIVTIHDVKMSAAGGKAGKGSARSEQRLVLMATAKTYRYLDEEAEE